MKMDHSIFPVEKLSDGSYRIEVSLEIYSKEAVSATCYRYLNSYFVTQKEGKDPKTIDVFLQPKENQKVVTNFSKQFCNDLIDQQVRVDVAKEFGSIRDKIVEQAFKPVN